MNETFFCTREFVEAWCSHFAGNLRPMPIAFSGGRDEVFAVATVGRSGLRSVGFAPSGFFASPGWVGELSGRVVEEILAQLQSRRVRQFVWNVRFDHAPLARKLSLRLPEVHRTRTQVLNLARDHEATFGRYNATMRNQVRKAHRSGLAVTWSRSEEELRSYYAIHERLAEAKGGYNFNFPLAFLSSLLRSTATCRLLVAKLDEKIVGGGIFLRDGNSVFYLHGAHDHGYSRYFPMCAVIDEAIRWAHEVGAATFNFGGSAGIDSLEKFKSFWGADVIHAWRFTWRNPTWNRLEGAKQWITNLASSP